MCGAGSGGSTVAGLLATDRDPQVLLLEAGPDDADDRIRVHAPDRWFENLGSERDSGYLTAPDLAGGPQNVVTLADFEGSEERGVLFSNGFHGHAFHAFGEVGELIAAGRFWLPVDRIFPLAEIAEAHRTTEQGGVRGRLVLALA